MLPRLVARTALPCRDQRQIDEYPQFGVASGDCHIDRRLEQNTLRDLWLRGAVPETRADAPLRDIVYVCVWSLLALTLIAIAGGVLIARRALKPLRAMALTAAQISGGDDLKKRMPDGGSDELAQLAGAFNGMMQRLDDAFEAE